MASAFLVSSKRGGLSAAVSELLTLADAPGAANALVFRRVNIDDNYHINMPA
jgi:hypothetical protein